MGLKNFIVLTLSVSLIIGVNLIVGLVGCIRGETATPETSTQIIEDITPQEAFTLIQNNQNNPDFVTIDVRTREEFTGGHIENATNIDFYSETFRGMLNNLDKNKTYLIYCRSGARSGSTLDIMDELNFDEVYNILGGMLQWQSEELPTVK